MNKEEAESKLLEIQSKNVLPFCPLIVGTCVVNCVCYGEARIVQSPVDRKYTVYKSYCGNDMFIGRL